MMIANSIIIFLATALSYTHAHAIEIPEAKFSPPEDINGLAHNHKARSIGNGPPSTNNIEDTVKEVEAMLKANPDLPRLTRGEILDLLENITKTDKLAHNTLYRITTTPKPRDAKAFMVVKPYTLDNTNGKNIEELYTKPPVTHIVGAQISTDGTDAKETQPQHGSNNLDAGSDMTKLTDEKVRKFRGDTYKRTTHSPLPESSTDVPHKENHSVIRNKYRRRKPQPAEKDQSTTVSPLVTTYSPRGKRPIRRRPGISNIEKHPNHKYPEELTIDSVGSSTSLPSNGMRVVSPPKLSPHVINDDLSIVEDQKKEYFSENNVPFSIERVTIRDIDLDDTSGSSSSNMIKIDVPEHLKGLAEDMDSESAIKQQHQKRKTTPKPLGTEEEEIRIKNMLAALGVVPPQISTTTTQIPDISNVADNLSPDMKDLLMSFGLIPNTQQKPVSNSPASDSFNPEKAEVRPESYTGFKPLPEDNESRGEMEEFLARFGLGRNSREKKTFDKQEALASEKYEKTVPLEDNLSFQMIPEEYQGVLEDIGLSNRNGKMIRTAPLVKTQEKQHIFNPTDNQYATQEELDKLNNLMTIIKQLESLNRTVTEEDLNEIDKKNLKDLIENLSDNTNKVVPLNEQNAPDPLKYDFGLSKNDVKRQKDTTTTTERIETTEESVTPNIKDLEDSFGGISDTVTETSPPETSTVSRRTGFYYLVDWNTFLDIDDQKGKRVNLRFQPTIGDPKRFYSVSVP